MKKKSIYISVFIVTTLLIIFLIYFYSIYSKRSSFDNYDTISKYVNENYKTLEQIANEYINGKEVKKPKNVISISVHSPDDIYVKNDNTIVQFATDGKGLVPSSTYYGFYYSKNDVPAAFENVDEVLIKYKKNSWKWIGTGDNHGKTIKIRDNWFYFDASF